MRENEHLDYHSMWENQRLDGIAEREAVERERFDVPSDDELHRIVDALERVIIEKRRGNDERAEELWERASELWERWNN